ncbi:protein of unknown function [Thiomonas sp. CB2]|nr:protein of unknown function [Thiomonas sp. CB2]
MEINKPGWLGLLFGNYWLWQRPPFDLMRFEQ